MTIDFDLLEAQLSGLLSSERDNLALSANFVALLNAEMPDINWVGLYVMRDEELVLGPFQGLPACTRIPLGQGVCGSAAQTKRSLRVEDVHEFDGHIACDPASRSELVVPLIDRDEVFAVLDIDSPLPGRFSTQDQEGVERLCARFVATLAGNAADRALAGFI